MTYCVKDLKPRKLCPVSDFSNVQPQTKDGIFLPKSLPTSSEKARGTWVTARVVTVVMNGIFLFRCRDSKLVTAFNMETSRWQKLCLTFFPGSWRMPIYMEMAQKKNKLQCSFLAHYFPKTPFNSCVAHKWDLMCF